MKILLNWIVFLAIAAGAFFLIRDGAWIKQHIVPVINLPKMPATWVIVFALSLAFVWVEVLKIGSVKPFTCTKCMCGWFALILGFFFHADFWYLLMPLGVFVGAMYEGIRMRWL